MWYSCTVAAGARFDEPPWEPPFGLASGVRIERIPDWVKADEALKYLSWSDRTHIQDAKWVLATEYEADALGSPDPDWQGLNPRGIQASVDEKFVLASIALWLAKASTITCGPTLHFGRKGDSESMRQSATLYPVLIRNDENDNIPTLTDLETAGRYLKAILDLKRDTTLWIAVRMLVSALTESMWEGRYLWQWIVLEALFGPDSPAESTHRLTQGISLFIEMEKNSKKVTFKMAKEAYGWRSKLVHGAKLSKLTTPKSMELTIFTEGLLRAAFRQILESATIAEILNGKNREEYLENLVFSSQ